ncbi:TMAO reductase system periplasmic protein TorT [Rhodopseudomonas sp. RCAM05734]|uniref:TMAO reductase system periplasmic protein TorT n=1 Tax=Rhodopseudomonas sp. RCAM05734 TaxID=3457549 RepID=UPI004044A9BE
MNLRSTLLTGSVFALFASSSYADDWFPYKAMKTEPPFAAGGKQEEVLYTPLSKASQPWKICVSFPHMKDAYWLGVDYGVVDEAKRLGVSMNLLNAGGYTELKTQISQIEDCVANGAQAVVIGAISLDGLNNLVAEVSKKGIPVIDVVNGISSPDVAAKSLVSFYTMGHSAGEYLAKKHPAGSKDVKVGWFPGPAGAGWVEAANKGFQDAVKDSAVKMLDAKYGDTGKEVQQKLVEDVLQSNPDIRYVAGTAVTAEAAQGVIRERGLQGSVNLLAFYMTPGVYDGIKRGFILAAPADSMVVQGRIAIDQAVRILEKNDYIKHVGPKIFVVDQQNVNGVSRTSILPPEDFKPLFKVN